MLNNGDRVGDLFGISCENEQVAGLSCRELDEMVRTRKPLWPIDSQAGLKSQFIGKLHRSGSHSGRRDANANLQGHSRESLPLPPPASLHPRHEEQTPWSQPPRHRLTQVFAPPPEEWPFQSFQDTDLHSLPVPRRISPATHEIVNSDEIDTCLSLARLPLPVRAAPAATSTAALPPTQRVLHVRASGRHWLHLEFQDGDNIEELSADFVQRQGLQASHGQARILNAVKSMTLLGLQEDSLDLIA
jgi:hypothetical protein